MKSKTAGWAGGITLAGTVVIGVVYVLLHAFTLAVLWGLLAGFLAACGCLWLFWRAAVVGAAGQKEKAIALFFARWAVAVAVILLSLALPWLDSVAVILPLTLPIPAAAILMAVGD